MVDLILEGFTSVLTPMGIFSITAGIVLGMVVGALPGLGPSIGCALMLPFTYTMEPAYALLLLVSVFQGAEFGGSISAILMNTPGTAGASCTTMDGYPMNRNGQPGRAIACALIPSCIGGFVGVVALYLLTNVIVGVAVKFGPAEYFALGLFGLTAVVSLSSGNIARGCISAVIGLMLSCVGLDVATGKPRFTMGNWNLYEGFSLVPVLIGMFAVSEALILISDELDTKYHIEKKGLRVKLEKGDFKSIIPAICFGSIFGTATGIFPGVGTTTASWLSYNQTKSVSKHPEKFGTGIPEGIAAPESANNAVVCSSLLPMLTLGIPGAPTAAIIMGAMIIHGVQPGTDIMTKHPGVVYTLYAGCAIAVLVMLLAGWLTSGLIANVVRLPNKYLAPMIIMLSFIGVYLTNGNVFSVLIAILFGILGYIFKKTGFPVAPFVLAFVLSELLENNLRRALLMGSGATYFLTRPVALVILAVTAVSLCLAIRGELKKKRDGKAAGSEGQ